MISSSCRRLRCKAEGAALYVAGLGDLAWQLLCSPHVGCQTEHLLADPYLAWGWAGWWVQVIAQHCAMHKAAG